MAEFKLPELGEDIEEADVLKVLVSEGDTVDVDQPLIEIETDKATVEVPSESAGKITKIHVKEGDTIKVGQVIVTIDGDAAPAREEAPPEEKEETKAEEPEEEGTAEEEPEEAAEGPAAEEKSEAEEEPAEAPEPVAEEEAEAEEERPAAEQPARRAKKAAVETPPPADQPTFASPSVRKFAREIGVDLSTVKGSGPGGRITEDDVKQASRERPAQIGEAPALPGAWAATEFRSLPDFAQWGPVRRQPMSRLRRTVSRNMSRSWTEIPHVHLDHHADITAMEELRQRYKERAKAAGGNLTISVMMLKIVAAALRAHPNVNSSYDPEQQELILKDYIHIGVAVDTDRGLVVPKIENVDQKNIIELSAELNEIAERARNNELTLEELRGSTFTVTNLGSLGTGHFSPIINWPEVAVLGLGRAEKRAAWDDQRQEFVPRLMMPLSLGHDHRVLDGADGARFITWIVDAIHNPLMMALEG